MNHACCAVYKRSGQNGLQCSLQSNLHSGFCVILCNMHAGAALVIQANFSPVKFIVPYLPYLPTYSPWPPLIAFSHFSPRCGRHGRPFLWGHGFFLLRWHDLPNFALIFLGDVSDLSCVVLNWLACARRMNLCHLFVFCSFLTKSKKFSTWLKLENCLLKWFPFWPDCL